MWPPWPTLEGLPARRSGRGPPIPHSRGSMAQDVRYSIKGASESEEVTATKRPIFARNRPLLATFGPPGGGTILLLESVSSNLVQALNSRLWPSVGLCGSKLDEEVRIGWSARPPRPPPPRPPPLPATPPTPHPTASHPATCELTTPWTQPRCPATPRLPIHYHPPLAPRLQREGPPMSAGAGKSGGEGPIAAPASDSF